MKIRRYRVKKYKKTEINFKNQDECISFFERQLNTWSKFKNYDNFNYQERFLNPKRYIEFLVSVFKKFKGTNAQLIINSPIRVILNGHVI